MLARQSPPSGVHCTGLAGNGESSFRALHSHDMMQRSAHHRRSMPPLLSAAMESGTLDRSAHVTDDSMLGCSTWSCVSVLAQEQLQLSKQQCAAMHAAHAAVLVQLGELLKARRALSRRLQVRAGIMQLTSLWAVPIP